MSLRVVLLGQFAPALQSQLTELASSMELQVVPSAPDIHGASQALVAPLPDIAVVSTTFRDGSGFDFVQSLSSTQRPVSLVFIGERDEDAVRAFELQATDFVLWPSASARLGDALSRARQQVLQLALLRTADELQRLLSEAQSAGGVDLGSLFGGRLTGISSNGQGGAHANGNGAYANGHANGNGHADGLDPVTRRRRTLGGAATGTLIASAPWRGGQRADARAGRLREGGEEAVLDLSREDGGRASDQPRPLRVLVREGRRTRFVPLAEVDWFEADGNYIRVHTGGDRHRTRGTITAIESALDPRQFVRIHRRIVVNMDRVREMSPLPGGDGLLVLGDGSTLRLSRTYRARVR
ncbi:MAG: response regulator transcription factor [Gemmatimonadaceae bacterium]|nr:response regulator transcription factor [Gemmatimonadaceae bacterium]